MFRANIGTHPANVMAQYHKAVCISIDEHENRLREIEQDVEILKTKLSDLRIARTEVEATIHNMRQKDDTTASAV